MPIFHREAFLAGADGKDTSWLRPEHFADLKGLSAALDRLCPEQRCDALYADWLLQLNSPARQALLQVRNLLLGQGALAANYLAELAQNADDASDGQSAQIRIVLDGEWLSVSNNGRKVTSLNLLGLCRFFVHAAGKFVELDEQTIGRFGIGFKSCYRIASEVFVVTWDSEGQFGFRLPICREGDAASEPDRERLERLLSQLQVVGVPQVDAELRDLRCLGYCTPEFLPELPSDLAQRTNSLRQTERGTLFCFHLRSDRRGEVASRITGQERELYELCPLFLPNLRLVQLAQHQLAMSVAGHDAAHDVSGLVEADRITLATSSISQPQSRQSRSRLWRLSGVAPGDAWKLALHADSSFRLRVEPEEDEHGTTIKDGAAFAFFPLNAVTKTWPFRLQLHLELPTNLSRDDWNPDDSPQVEEQLRRAVSGLALWLEQHSDKWHANWRVDSLVVRKPNPNERWAWRVWELLRGALAQHRLMRAFTGGFTTVTNPKAINVLDRPEAQRAWKIVIENSPAACSSTQLVAVESESPLVSSWVSAEEAASFCVAAVRAAPERDDIHQAALTAFLGSHNLSLHKSPAAFYDVLGSIQCRFKDGDKIALAALLRQPAGAELSDEWHDSFRLLAGWASDMSWALASVEGKGLPAQFRKLARPVFNPPWKQLPRRMGDAAAWEADGEQFWKTPRTPCPVELRAPVLASLRVPADNGRWLPIAGLWLGPDAAVPCFGGLLPAWPLGTNAVRKQINELLNEWDLADYWEHDAQERLKTGLPGVLARALADHCQHDAFVRVFSETFKRARCTLTYTWKPIVAEAVETAVHRFLTARQSEDGMQDKTLLSCQIPRHIRAALELLPGYQDAPPWLTEPAWVYIRDLGLPDVCKFKFLLQETWIASKVGHARELLENFHRWTTASLSEAQSAGLNELASAASVAQRRDWTVGLSPQKRRPLRELLLAKPSSSNPTVAERIESRLLKKAESRVEPLPPVLANLPAVAEACVQMDKVKLAVNFGVLAPIDYEQIAHDLQADLDLQEALTSGHRRLFGSPNELNLQWLYGGEVAAVLNNADFVLCDDRLVVHRFGPPAGENQYSRILAEFETHSTPPPEYTADQGLSAFDRYQRNREAIRSTLLKELVAKVGYAKHHVLRELLQNAESAYASKQGRPVDGWFEFEVTEAAVAGRRQIVARHAGRGFNEPDCEGKPRHDIERIWRLAAESERTPEEVGRFNRGFKTVFTVAADGVVRIRSGQFDFEIIDLLLLRPADPQPSVTPPAPATEFSFEVTHADALEVLGLGHPPNPDQALPVLNASSLVFLRHLSRVKVRFGGWEWAWVLSRRAELEGWQQVKICCNESSDGEEFHVFAERVRSRQCDQRERRLAVAVRLDRDGLPRPLEKAWRCFRLTFETDQVFPLDFLVHGDFEADQGRVGLRNIARSGLVEPAYEAVLSRAERDLLARPQKVVWLAWARVLHLKEAPTELEAAFGDDVRLFRRIAERAKESFTTHIPHGGELVPASRLEFPTRLMRRLAGQFASQWGLTTSDWIDSEIAEWLPNTEQPRLSLPRWLADIPPMSPVLETVKRCLGSLAAARPSLDGIEQDELREAMRLLEEKLRPTLPPPPPEPSLPEVERWTVANLWHWWERKGTPVADYTLDGENWTLLYPRDETVPAQRKARLRQDLSRPETDDGRRVWYRLLGLACLMSAGWGRMSTLREFWRDTLEADRFWDRTAGGNFADETCKLFSTLVLRVHPNAAASGEAAEYWRHVFYDIRKVHELVWQHEFADTVLQLASDAARAHELPQFLRSGQLSDQKPWAGVLGQSTGAPLFFVVRELCRLGVIESPALESLKPLAFFPCKPVRRAAVRIGCLDPELASRTDFQSLAEVSDRIYRWIEADREFGQRLLEFYDIPLLHFGLTE